MVVVSGMMVFRGRLGWWKVKGVSKEYLVWLRVVRRGVLGLLM